MASLGMKTPVSAIEDYKSKLMEKHQKMYTRKPTKLEKQSLDILSGFIKKINPLLVDEFSNASYTIGDSDEIVGELREKRNWGEEHIYLSKRFFTSNFSTALAILLHEWGHIFGYDGSREFTDVLTEFISAIIKERDTLDDYEKQWKKISAKIKKAQKETRETSKVFSRVDRLSSKQKSKILKNLPEDEIYKLLERENFL